MNQLHLPNIRYQKTVSSQVSIDKCFNSLTHMKVIARHTFNRHNYTEKHSPQLKQI